MGASRLILTTVTAILLGLSSAASAAPPLWSWTGFYLGGNVGYSWGKSDTNFAFSDSLGSLFTAGGTVHVNGVIGGGTTGYNWQNGNWIYGLEADIQGSGQSGDATFTCAAGVCSASAVTTTVTEKLKWFGTVRPRLGWNVTPTMMVYATGGLAYGQVIADGVISNALTSTAFSVSKTSAGWTVGAGLEGQLSGNWTWKIEYLYLELQEPTGTFATSIIGPGGRGGGTPVTVLLDPTFSDNIVRVGLNYKWP